MRYNCFLFAAVFCFCFCACGGELGPEMEEVDQTPFFDLQGYFADQVESLQEQQPAIRKQLRINEEEEEKKMEDVNYSAELAIFSKADINRPAWFDKYEVDSVYRDQQLSEIRYTATDPSLKIRNLVIAFDSTGVDWITVDNLTSSFIAETEQHLWYDRQKGYTIDSRQKIIFSSDKEVSVEAVFVE